MEAMTIHSITTRFQAAVRNVAALPRHPDRIAEVQLHALYRQATEGDCHDPRPSGADIGLRFRHDAWRALQGMPPETAMERYIAMADELALALRH